MGLNTVTEGLKRAIIYASEIEKEDANSSASKACAYAAERMRLLISRIEKSIKADEEFQIKHWGRIYGAADE